MSYYPEPDSHIREKNKVVLDLPNYVTKNKLDHSGCVDTSDLAAQKDFITLKAEVDKLDINKLVNVPTSLNNLKAKVYDLDVRTLKTIPVEWKKFSDALDNEVINNTKFKTLEAKVKNLEKKIRDATTSIHINQYNADKQNLDKKIGVIDEKIPPTSGLVATTVLNTKISQVEKKIFSHDKYITTTEFNKLIAEGFIAGLRQADLVKKSRF